MKKENVIEVFKNLKSGTFMYSEIPVNEFIGELQNCIVKELPGPRWKLIKNADLKSSRRLNVIRSFELMKFGKKVIYENPGYVRNLVLSYNSKFGDRIKVKKLSNDSCEIFRDLIDEPFISEKTYLMLKHELENKISDLQSRVRPLDFFDNENTIEELI